MNTNNHIKALQTRIAENGDYAAYKELYYLLYKELFRFAKVIVFEKELAEEVLQDVFTKLYIKRDKLHTVNNLKVYLYSCVKNTAINHRKKYPLQSLTKLDLSSVQLGYNERTPEDLMISVQTTKFINSAIHALPPKCKIIFLLVKEDGLSYKAVAEILNISVKTVENQMSIAIKKIATALYR